MAYIDGFVVPILPGKRDAYRETAMAAAPIFLEHGALQVVESIGDDVPHGKVTDFYRAVSAEEGELVNFSWILWPSKATRNAGMAKVMADDRMKNLGEMPFDMKRMIFGGFEVILDTALAEGEGS
ncbi:DUF1428 domain-containing protein [Sphingomonas crusticola]|uniref:DUF1428 domain-containing protein n=1 Tax=Sphingomonas crusticola TaxID=1697973 RepID=UPI000E249DC7|nr:DUF1428 domain-containing protein [Sphingomonas crusticola]